ncbi:winged helix-turn-helix domain-containing protein [Paenibacillus sp. PL91]|uniref:winged helix-turn-helix domain-containing protein n=1 Tax=Paenibacillus sp. PL91 TaxID=2729538 RepID=UPI00145F47BC|nr:transcriptional regulator [Paenibacillus sp. PL91]MBC9202976.1 transcriptional regulator [Paenibacillus sp. PL91]
MSDNLLDAIDDTIHAKARLGIMSLLMVHGECDFSFLRGELSLTEGNLGNHIRVLEEAAYIQVEKTFAGRRPKTICSPTQLGLDMFQQYIEGLEKIIQMARSTKKDPEQQA